MNSFYTSNYFKKKCSRLLFNEASYNRIKLYKIIFDFKIGRSYENLEAVLPMIIPNSAVVLDIGANVGQYACRLSKYLKKGSIFSFEPVGDNFRLLKEMKNMLHMDNVSIFRNAVSDSSSYQTMKIPILENRIPVATQAFLDNYGSHEFENVYYRKERVMSITIDEFVSEKRLSRLDLIKLDTEGAEIAIMKGALDTLKSKRPIIMAEIHPDDSKLDFLFDMGYEAYDFINGEIIKSKNYNFKRQRDPILICSH